MYSGELLATYPVLGGAYLLAGRAASEMKRGLAEVGLPAAMVRRAAVAVYEAEMNICIHAIAGQVAVSAEGDRVVVVVTDRGQGILDVAQALLPGYSTAPQKARERGFGAGLGLSNMQQCADEFTLTSQPGIGTRVEMTFFPRPEERGRD